MRTNFYLIYNELVDTECPCCGHIVQEKRKRHLGKSSGGWCYALHVYPEEGLNDFVSICQEVGICIGNGGHIEDEYGDAVEWHEWHKNVTERSAKEPVAHQRDLAEAFGNRRYQSVKHYLDAMHAVEGPNNLLRHKIDGRYCIGHGSGTWDYLVGDFS